MEKSECVEDVFWQIGFYGLREEKKRGNKDDFVILVRVIGQIVFLFNEIGKNEEERGQIGKFKIKVSKQFYEVLLIFYR